jgi:hypothetical protein
MSDLLRPDFLFVSVILPILIMIGAWIALKLHNRWLDREREGERKEAAAAQSARNHPPLKSRPLRYLPSRQPSGARRRA